MPASLIERTVFVVSDSTGITAETFSNSVLSQFEQVKFAAIRIPFLDSPEKAAAAALRLNKCARSEEHTSELQSLMRTSYAIVCLTEKSQQQPVAQNTRIRNTYDNSSIKK